MNILREPLVQFLVAGALLFLLNGWLGSQDASTERPVMRLTQGEVDWLVDTWSRRWRRAPDELELQNLVTEYLREQLLAREARALGLDQNDAVITTRLAQKMEFLIEDTTSITDPSDEKLLAHYNAALTRYQEPARMSFTQIFFRTEAAAQGALDTIDSQNSDSLGDPSLLDRNYAMTDMSAIGRTFGDDFAASLAGLQTGYWTGPIASAFGFHLVQVLERQESRQLEFAQARDRVLQDWRRAETERAGSLLFAELLKKYDVVADDSVRRLLEARLALLADAAQQ